LHAAVNPFIPLAIHLEFHQLKFSRETLNVLFLRNILLLPRFFPHLLMLVQHLSRYSRLLRIGCKQNKCYSYHRGCKKMRLPRSCKSSAAVQAPQAVVFAYCNSAKQSQAHGCMNASTSSQTSTMMPSNFLKFF